MDHIVNYAERRAAMAADSRRRILEAATAVLARGVDELSMPAVAREAGVSVPTVYRNFPDKNALLRETLQHLRQQRDYRGLTASLDELEASMVREFDRAATVDESVRVALTNQEVVAEMHAAGVPAQRKREVARLLGPHLDALPRRD